MEKYSDEQIVEGLKSRSNDIASYLYERYFPMIRCMTRKNPQRNESADDLFQEVFVALLTETGNPDFKLEHKFTTYIYAVCFNIWSKKVRSDIVRKKFLMSRPKESIENEFSEIFDNREFEIIYWKVFESLEIICQTILKLAWNKGMSLKEVADVLGNKYSYIRKRKCECASYLYEEIKSHPVIRCLLNNR